MTTEHSTLTGSSLHEPKGIAAAAANKVYVSDGAASGSWKVVPYAAVDGSVNAFGTQLLHVREEQTAGTNGSSYSSGAWRTVVLNTTKTNEISSASLTSNVISLPVGTYFIEASFSSGANSVGSAKLRLRNTSDGTTSVVGVSCMNDSSVSRYPRLLKGRFTLSGTKTLELQVNSSNGEVAQVAANLGEVEVYSDVLIWKIA